MPTGNFLHFGECGFGSVVGSRWTSKKISLSAQKAENCIQQRINTFGCVSNIQIETVESFVVNKGPHTVCFGLESALESKVGSYCVDSYLNGVRYTRYKWSAGFEMRLRSSAVVCGTGMYRFSTQILVPETTDDHVRPRHLPTHHVLRTAMGSQKGHQEPAVRCSEYDGGQFLSHRAVVTSLPSAIPYGPTVQ